MYPSPMLIQRGGWWTIPRPQVQLQLRLQLQLHHERYIRRLRKVLLFDLNAISRESPN